MLQLPDLTLLHCVQYYQDRYGYVVWRRGTGDNVELVHIKSESPANGYGKYLLTEMLKQLKKNPPFHTVFGFTRTSNGQAIGFYRAMGFTLTLVDGVYKDGAAYLFSAPYTALCDQHCI